MNFLFFDLFNKVPLSGSLTTSLLTFIHHQEDCGLPLSSSSWSNFQEQKDYSLFCVAPRMGEPGNHHHHLWLFGFFIIKKCLWRGHCCWLSVWQTMSTSKEKKQVSIVEPPPSVDVIFWGIDMSHELRKDEGDKVKICCLHVGARPWVLSIDREDEIHVWDYSSRQRLMRKSLLDLYTSAVQNERLAQTRAAPTKNEPPFTERRFLESSHSCTQHSHPLKSYLGSFEREILGFKSRGKNLDDLVEKTESKKHSNNPVKVTMGNVHQISFVDQSSIQNSSGDSFAPHIPTFNVETRIMIVCDAGVLFYDFSTEASHVITVADLGSKAPCCAEFVFSNLCAIGCADGIVRIWDCQKWIEIKTLSGHNRGDILALKNLPILRSQLVVVL